jgi:hypothetical protein
MTVVEANGTTTDNPLQAAVRPRDSEGRPIAGTRYEVTFTFTAPGGQRTRGRGAEQQDRLGVFYTAQTDPAAPGTYTVDATFVFGNESQTVTPDTVQITAGSCPA